MNRHHLKKLQTNNFMHDDFFSSPTIFFQPVIAVCPTTTQFRGKGNMSKGKKKNI